MRNPGIEKEFNEHIDTRLASREWSAEISRSVLARSRLERKKKITDIAALVFPFAAAAVLIMAILPFGGITTGNGNRSVLTSTSDNGEQYSSTAPALTDLDVIAGYFPDF